MRVFILCGIGTKWHNYLGKPKQLAPIMGQPLLLRTLQQLYDLGLKDIHLITNDARLHIKGIASFAPAAHRWSSEVLAATKPLWGKNQVVLLGDVYYTTAALKTIIHSDAKLMFFGCPYANPHTGTPWGELYGLKFTHTEIKPLETALTITLADAAEGGRGKLWELHIALLKKSLISARKTHRLYTEDSHLFTIINDLTDDIDMPEDYHRLCQILQLTVPNP